MRPTGWLLAAILGAMLGHETAQAVEPVDLNSAPVEQLQGLPGIGPKKAEAIIALRHQRAFSRVSQLLEVRGIGRKTLERLKPLVRVGAVVGRIPTSLSRDSSGASKEVAATIPEVQ